MEENEDFESVFNILDPGGMGYISSDVVQHFYQDIFGVLVSNALIKFASSCFEKNDSICSRKNFKDILTKIEECRCKEENIYWDFMAMSESGSVSTKNGLFLARTFDGNDFSISKWNSWNNERTNPDSPFCWNEFKTYLYYIASAGGSSQNYNEVYEKYSASEHAKIEEEYNRIVSTGELDEDQLNAEKYVAGVQYESGRLVNRWNVAGIEAVINDDGEEWDLAPVKKREKPITDSVTSAQVLSLLNEKYELLRNQLLYEMASNSNSEGDVDSTYMELLQLAKDVKKTNNFEKIKTFHGSQTAYKMDMQMIMGNTEDTIADAWKRSEERFKTLKSEGKTTEEINLLFQEETIKQMEVSYAAGDLLRQLYERETKEENILMKKINDIEESEYLRIVLFSLMKYQCQRINLDKSSFISAAMSAALAERRTVHKNEIYNPDRPRQQTLANLRIKSFNDDWARTANHDFLFVSKEIPLPRQIMMLLSGIFNKHSCENKVSLDCIANLNESQKAELNSSTITEIIMERRKLKKEAEVVKNLLKNQDKEPERLRYSTILKRAAVLYAEDMKQRGEYSDISEAAAFIQSQIQIVQDMEIQEIIKQIYDKKPDVDTINNYLNVAKASLYDNIAHIVFQDIQSTPEEDKLASVILEKYDDIREKIFAQYMDKQNKDGEDKTKMLEKLRAGEKKNREERNHAKLARLCKNMFKITNPLQEFMGPDMSSFSITSQNGFMKLEDSSRNHVSFNEEEYILSDDPLSVDGNLLSQLQARYEDEVSNIFESIRGLDVNDQPFKIIAETIWQKWQKMTASVDLTFASSALGIGLKERIKIGEGKVRLRKDNSRYIQIAQERFNSSNPMKLPLQSKTKSSAPETALKKVLGCHISEWRRLNGLLVDPNAEELREAAGVMTEDERSSRLAEINAKRMKLDINSSDWQEDMIAMLDEAAAIKHVSRKQLMLQVAGESGASNITDDDIIISIMADLQEEHNIDGLRWFNNAVEDPQNVTKIKDAVLEESKMAKNIFNVLCKYEGAADDDELIQALEDKYDALRDKLLADLLMKQLGNKRWHEMNERERQRMLMKLKLEERKLRKEGDFDALARLLGGHFDDEEKLRKLLGMTKEEYERRLKERLKNRTKNGVNDIEESEEAGEDGDILTDLTSRFEEERDALMRLLKGQDDRFLSERERQLRLSRLQREARIAEREDNFGAAALVLGLAERNALNAERLEADKKRQRDLAKLRLEALRKRARDSLASIAEEDEEICTEGGKAVLGDAVIKKMEALFACERQWLMNLISKQESLNETINNTKQRNPIDVSNDYSSTQITDFLNKIFTTLPNQPVSVKEHSNALTEASILRQGLLVQHERGAKTKEELDELILMLLQDVHDETSRKIEEDVANMNEEQLIEKQKFIVEDIKQFKSSNLLKVLFSTTNSLIEATKGKYDAIIDSLIIDALKEQYGEDKWNSMSEEERKKLINEMRNKLRRLISDGNLDEAEKLFGSKHRELLNSLFGKEVEKQEQERLLQERLERKRQRIVNGMSEAEAQALFDKETQEEEEMLQKRRKNILENLNFDVDAMKDELLTQKLDADKKFEEERRRQKELAILRMQERMFRREQDVDAIAALLALSKTHVDQLDKERERQLALARSRLQAFKNSKNQDTAAEDTSLTLPDTNDAPALLSAVMKQLELKHANEREVLMKMLKSEEFLKYKSTAAEMESDKRQSKISELRSLRKQWRNEDLDAMTESKEEHYDILKEAAGIRSVDHADVLRTNNPDFTDEEVTASILASLQEEQMKETALLVEDISDKNAETLRSIAKVQWEAREYQWLDNIATSLLHQADASENQEVLDAVDEKYDSLKNKLIMEALMKQVGEQAWAAMSQKDRQHKLMKLKMEERKLRSQGKLDEAAALLSNLFETNEELNKLFGKNKLTQEEALKARLDRRKELIKEREDAGLSVSDADIDKELDKEEATEKEKRKNILLSLEYDLEKEKAALLASLDKQNDMVSAERKRQLEIAKIRRHQRQLEKTEQMDSIALIFHEGKAHETALATSMEANRARQKSLAEARLVERRAKRAEKEALKKLLDADTIEQTLIDLEAEEEKALPQDANYYDQLMMELEVKHSHERELFMLFNSAALHDRNEMQEVEAMDVEELEEKKSAIWNSRKEWREKRLITALHDFSDEANDPGKKSRRRKLLAEEIAEQNEQMKKYVMFELELLRRKDGTKDVVAFKKDKAVEWLTGIQEAQHVEVDIVTNMVEDKANDVLDMIRRDQLKARKEQWHDNFCRVVMQVMPPGQVCMSHHDRPDTTSSLEQEEKQLQQQTEEEIQNLDEEIKQQQEEIQKRKNNGEEIDVDAALAALNAQHEARKKMINDTKMRQKQAIEEKLRERRLAKDNEEFEAHAAASMVLLAERRIQAKKESDEKAKLSNKSLMQQRLEERRKRRKEMDEELKKGEEKEEDDDSPVPLPPRPMLKREKTIANFSISDTERNELMKEIERKSEEYQKKQNLIKQKQLEMIQAKRDAAESRKRNQVKEILNQQTIVREKTMTQIQRQKTMLKDRITNIRTEKTQTMREKSDKTRQDFEALIEKDQAAGLTEDERMTLAAKNLQKKYVSEAKIGDIAKIEDEKLSADEDESTLKRAPSRKLTKEEREAAIKQRLLEKKQRQKMDEQMSS